MNASLILQSDVARGITLEVNTKPHPVLGDRQMTTLTIGRLVSGGWHLGNCEVKHLDATDRKALAHFLLSIPDDQP